MAVNAEGRPQRVNRSIDLQCPRASFSTGQSDRLVEAQRPDIVFVNKQAKEAMIIDVAVPGNGQVKGQRTGENREVPTS